MTPRAKSLLSAVSPDVLRSTCYNLFGIKCRDLTKDEIIEKLDQTKAIKIFMTLHL